MAKSFMYGESSSLAVEGSINFRAAPAISPKKHGRFASGRALSYKNASALIRAAASNAAGAFDNCLSRFLGAQRAHCLARLPHLRIADVG